MDRTMDNSKTPKTSKDMHKPSFRISKIIKPDYPLSVLIITDTCCRYGYFYKYGNAQKSNSADVQFPFDAEGRKMDVFS